MVLGLSAGKGRGLACGGPYEFEHVPVKDVVVGEALAVEEVSEELA